MKKLYTLAVAFFALLSVDAQINPDTTFYPQFENNTWSNTSPFSNQTYRYAYGTNSYAQKHTHKAQLVAPTEPLHPNKEHIVQGIGFKTLRRGAGAGASSVVKFQIYDLNAAGLPSTVLAEVEIPFSDIKNNAFTWASFPQPVTFQATDAYAIGYDFSTLAPLDSMAGFVSSHMQVTQSMIGFVYENDGIVWRRVNSGLSEIGDDVTLYAKVAWAEIDTAVSVQNRENDFVLFQNHPNPFRDQTTISYSITKASNVTLEVYDVTGRLVESRSEGIKPVGAHTYILNANNYNQGLYYYVLKAGDYSATKKMLVVR